MQIPLPIFIFSLTASCRRDEMRAKANCSRNSGKKFRLTATSETRELHVEQNNRAAQSVSAEFQSIGVISD